MKALAVPNSQSQWCIEEVKADIWGLGVTVLNLFLGSNTPRDKQNVSHLMIGLCSQYVIGTIVTLCYGTLCNVTGNTA